MADEAWGVSTGLPLDDVDATITKMEFGYNAQIGAGVMCANITFKTDDGEEHEQSFTIGNGWEITGKGAEISGRKTINANTNYGRLVGSMVKTVGPENMSDEFPDPRGFRLAAQFVGSRWHLGTEKVETTNPTTGEKKAKDAIVFTKYLGKSDGDGGSGAKSKSGKSSGKATLKDTDPELFAKLVKKAKAFDSHEEFVEAVLDAYEDNQAAVNAIMSSKAGSPWAEAQGDDE